MVCKQRRGCSSGYLGLRWRGRRHSWASEECLRFLSLHSSYKGAEVKGSPPVHSLTLQKQDSSRKLGKLA